LALALSLSCLTTLGGMKLSRPPAASDEPPRQRQVARQWLAGDHHIHSQYSVGWDTTTNPPTPVVAGDARYPIPTNAEMAKRHGLSWMVSTDHGGPNHSKVNLEMAYPELLESREAVPGLIQFYGMEFDTPGAEHSSLIIPHSHEEHATLYDLESRFARREPFPPDSTRHTEAAMLNALAYMRGLSLPPLLFANHPSRSARGLGVYGSNTPRELRNWNNTAPRVATGMEGAPGHQARAIAPDGSIDPEGVRGGYRNHPTMGGFDQMTARLGGFWDSMLGEGRRWWITSTSDSHVHWREGGSDFWPGEYSKTYVFAEHSYDDILDGLRNGRVFVTTGDLISELDVTVAAGGREASIGEEVDVEAGENMIVTIRLRDPESANPHGETPAVRHVDLIFGEITGILEDLTTDTNPTTHVVARFTSEDWEDEGEYREMTYTLENVRLPGYVRVRGTNTDELEPQIDPPGEDPWSDLWFYSNPVFIDSR
ncbi:MAG: phosphoesterase, partial [Longimicrobiales bacterium]